VVMVGVKNLSAWNTIVAAKDITAVDACQTNGGCMPEVDTNAFVFFQVLGPGMTPQGPGYDTGGGRARRRSSADPPRVIGWASSARACAKAALTATGRLGTLRPGTLCAGRSAELAAAGVGSGGGRAGRNRNAVCSRAPATHPA
jgi:hypothetical protein